MIAGIVIGCYALAWLYTARLLYGRWRANGIDHNREHLPYVCPDTAKAIDSWNEIDRGPVMAGALALGLIWPLTLIAVPVIRFIDSAPQLSQAEMRDRLRARDRRIAELEREAGIRPG
jgi:hypothetical protein